MSRKCTELNCMKDIYARGLCRCHYRSVLRAAQLGLTATRTGISPERLEQECAYLTRAVGRTHCRHGHAFTPENTAMHRKGYLVCKICRRAWKQKYHSKPVDMATAIGSHNRDKTHCKAGHAFAEHSRPRASGGRICKTCSSHERRSRLYGLSQQQFEQLIQQQGGQCALCRKPFAAAQQTHVDHDHTTLIVRGVLCSRCNTALGLLRDDPDLMRKAAGYVEQHRVPDAEQVLVVEAVTEP